MLSVDFDCPTAAVHASEGSLGAAVGAVAEPDDRSLAGVVEDAAPAVAQPETNNAATAHNHAHRTGCRRTPAF